MDPLVHIADTVLHRFPGPFRHALYFDTFTNGWVGSRVILDNLIDVSFKLLEVPFIQWAGKSRVFLKTPVPVGVQIPRAWHVNNKGVSPHISFGEVIVHQGAGVEGLVDVAYQMDEHPQHDALSQSTVSLAPLHIPESGLAVVDRGDDVDRVFLEVFGLDLSFGEQLGSVDVLVVVVPGVHGLPPQVLDFVRPAGGLDKRVVGFASEWLEHSKEMHHGLVEGFVHDFSFCDSGHDEMTGRAESGV